MFASTAATSVGYVYTAEVYPTEIRNVGVGCSSSAAMAGALCAPLMKLLGDAVWWLPPMINGTLGTFCLLRGNVRGKKIPLVMSCYQFKVVEDF